MGFSIIRYLTRNKAAKWWSDKKTSPNPHINLDSLKADIGLSLPLLPPSFNFSAEWKNSGKPQAETVFSLTPEEAVLEAIKVERLFSEAKMLGTLEEFLRTSEEYPLYKLIGYLHISDSIQESDYQIQGIPFKRHSLDASFTMPNTSLIGHCVLSLNAISGLFLNNGNWDILSGATHKFFRDAMSETGFPFFGVFSPESSITDNHIKLGAIYIGGAEELKSFSRVFGSYSKYSPIGILSDNINLNKLSLK